MHSIQTTTHPTARFPEQRHSEQRHPPKDWREFNALYYCSRLINQYHAMRHGQSTANAERRWVSSPDGCINNHGLTELGVSQVEQSTHAALRAGIISQRTVLISSDYRRARETAETVARVAGISTVILDARLRERGCGDMEGKTFTEELGRQWLEEIRRIDLADPFSSPFGQEPLVDVMARCSSLVRELESRQDSSVAGGKHYLLVAHGDLLHVALCMAAKVSPGERWGFGHIDNASIHDLNARFVST